MRRLGLLCLTVVAALSGVGAARTAVHDPYAGLGAWVDIFDTRTWANPAGPIASMASAAHCSDGACPMGERLCG